VRVLILQPLLALFEGFDVLDGFVDNGGFVDGEVNFSGSGCGGYLGTLSLRVAMLRLRLLR